MTGDSVFSSDSITDTHSATGTDPFGRDGGSASGGSPGAAWFVRQPKAESSRADEAARAALSGGVLSVGHRYPASSNLFKSDGVNTAVNRNASFVAWPAPLAGDFSVEATVTVTGRNKVSSTSGIGVGMFDSFDPDCSYALMLLTTSLTANLQYAEAPGRVVADGAGGTYAEGVPVRVSFRREGATLSWEMRTGIAEPASVAAIGPVSRPGPADGEASAPCPAAATGTGEVSIPVLRETRPIADLWRGEGYPFAGPVYAGLAFGNADATVGEFIVRGASGEVLWDSREGRLEEKKAASLEPERDSVELRAGGSSVSVQVLAFALGGAPATVSVTGEDDTVARVSVDNSVFPARIDLAPVGAGVFSLLITNDADEKKRATLAACVADYPKADGHEQLGPDRAWPVAGSADDALPGCVLSLKFDAPPSLVPGYSIKILRADGTLADSVSFGGEWTQSGSRKLFVGDRLVRVEGIRLVLRPHPGALEPGEEYFVAIPTGAVSGSLNGKPFLGLSDDPGRAGWRFRTRVRRALDAGSVTVDPAPGAQADFAGLQAALDALETALPDAESVTIRLARGTYAEPVTYTGGKRLTITGPEGNDHGADCVIRWVNSNVMNGSNAGRALFYASGGDLRLENLTIENLWVRRPNADNQAEALNFAGGPGNRLVARNCTFRSTQDTLQLSGRAWFYGCRIEGNTDFLWGTADAALFERCELRCVNDGLECDAPLMVARTPIRRGKATVEGPANPAVQPAAEPAARPAAPARESGSAATETQASRLTVGKGFVLLDSTVSVDAGITAWYGRNAGGSGFLDQVALLRVAFSGEGRLGGTLWKKSAYYHRAGDASRVGWKSYSCEGLGAGNLACLEGASPTIDSREAEYGNRDAILNRVVVLSESPGGGYAATGFADAPERWDLTALEADFGLDPGPGSAR